MGSGLLDGTVLRSHCQPRQIQHLMSEVIIRTTGRPTYICEKLMGTFFQIVPLAVYVEAILMYLIINYQCERALALNVIFLHETAG